MIRLRTVLAAATASLMLGGCAFIAARERPAVDGWSPTPTTAVPVFADVAERECLSILDLPAASVVQDQRGDDGALFLFRDGRTEGSCLILRSADDRLRVQGLGIGYPAIEGTLRRMSSGGHGYEDGTSITEQSGTVPEGTAGVEIELVDGTVIEATVGDGRYAAWWLDDDTSVEIRALDQEGSVIATAPGVLAP